MWNIQSVSLILLSIIYIPIISCYKNDYHREKSRQTHYTVENIIKIKCFQCNQPYDCMTGLCWGDICVKSQVNAGYVSKGCENFTTSVGLYEPHLKQKQYCREEEVLGAPTINCFCRDQDFCNSTSSNFSIILIILLLLLISIRL
ncbi:unnamed protein product [Caenorhabditis angaria]|uniref:Uncharacterized protein n=1 Tax=Caenorhabditis angaria TaxID=860376 RepID=A0A9P1MV55_9PELO|nr:unnamed protein product [Caenorhabditis angaria]